MVEKTARLPILHPARGGRQIAASPGPVVLATAIRPDGSRGVSVSPMASDKILLVEDAPDLRAGLRAALEEIGAYEVFEAEDGRRALTAFFAVRPDLVLLDIGLPGMNGFDICERMREVSDVPVIVFSCRNETEAKLEAFRRGADDYVVKDVQIDELLARIDASLRRARAHASSGEMPDAYSDPVLQLDLTRSTATVRGKPVDLTLTEYRLLSLLVQHPRRPFRAEELLHRVWGAGYHSEDQVKWHIGHLRRKIERDCGNPELLVTRRGFGYSYVPPPAPAASWSETAAVGF